MRLCLVNGIGGLLQQGFSMEMVIVRKLREKAGGWCFNVVKEELRVGMLEAIRRGWEGFKSRSILWQEVVKEWSLVRISTLLRG